MHRRSPDTCRRSREPRVRAREREGEIPLFYISASCNARDRCDVAISRRQPPRPRIAPASFFPKPCAVGTASRPSGRRGRQEGEMASKDEKKRNREGGGGGRRKEEKKKGKIGRADGAKIVPLFAF